MISAEISLQAQFYQIDPMNVVWHGHYVQFFEQARSALLARIGYNYREMAASGFGWPIVDLRVKYVKPITLGQRFVVRATLVEYENRIRIDYRVMDQDTRAVLTKAQTTQLAVDIATGELSFESPAALIDRVRALL
jgi:acyl-CoA thioester hydrolase